MKTNTISQTCLSCSWCSHWDTMKSGVRNGGWTTTKKLLNCKLITTLKKQSRLQTASLESIIKFITMMLPKKYFVSYAINHSLTAMNSLFTVRKISITKLLLINSLMKPTTKSLKSWTDRKLHKSWNLFLRMITNWLNIEVCLLVYINLYVSKN